MKFVQKVFALSLILLIVGCGDVRQESERWRKAVDELGSNMVDASDSFDPIALKEIFRKLHEAKANIADLERSEEHTSELQSQ